MAGNVWFQSMKFHWCWKRNDRLAMKRIRRKYEKSLMELKVKIGSINFVEKNTPFVYHFLFNNHWFGTYAEINLND
jgi:hypothetical protein